MSTCHKALFEEFLQEAWNLAQPGLLQKKMYFRSFSGKKPFQKKFTVKKNGLYKKCEKITKFLVEVEQHFYYQNSTTVFCQHCCELIQFKKGVITHYDLLAKHIEQKHAELLRSAENTDREKVN